MPLSKTQLDRYARHILLKEIGGPGQARLLDARVLVVGAGGIGAPLILYLAGAGVGHIGVVDNDTVSLSNLQRQIIYDTDMTGRSKVDSAAKRIAKLNSDVEFKAHDLHLDASNAGELIEAYDIVVDGCDNYPTRILVNDGCFFSGKPLVSAAVGQFEGQLATFKAHESTKSTRLPCYRCLYPQSPPAGSIMNCEEAGVLGAITGVMGTLAAVEVIKEILNIGDSLAGKLLVYEGLKARMRTISLTPDPACALCGAHPQIADLSVHAA